MEAIREEFRGVAEVPGLHVRMYTPHHLIIGGDHAALAGLTKAIRSVCGESDTVGEAGPLANEAMAYPNKHQPGDFSQLRIVRNECHDGCSHYRKCIDGLPRKFQPLLEMDMDEVEKPTTIQMTRAVCDVEPNPCEWSGWILSAVEARRTSGDGSDEKVLPLSADTRAVCPRCGKTVRSLSRVPFVRAPEQERLGAERPTVECAPLIYDDDPPEPEPEECDGEEELVNCPETFFLAAWRETDERLTIAGNRESLKWLADRCGFSPPDERDHDHIELTTKNPAEFWKILVEQRVPGEVPTSAEPASQAGSACADPPGLAALRYGVCATETNACAWQGWLLECNFNAREGFPDGELWRVATHPSPEWTCPRCGRAVIDLDGPLWFAPEG